MNAIKSERVVPLMGAGHCDLPIRATAAVAAPIEGRALDDVQAGVLCRPLKGGRSCL
jgi:hypothetical protein